MSEPKVRDDGLPPGSFREKATEYFIRELGEPVHIQVKEGTIFRWTIRRRDNMDLAIYITLDSPEMPDIAHVMISDPGCIDAEPIKSYTLRTEDEFAMALGEIRRRMNGGQCQINL
ncbi:MAG TPA: hypothetical protein VD997_00455 [Phycisphaerales bacterium]|nr:hypothetical protein [Phycisphaerales bacterium]